MFTPMINIDVIEIFGDDIALYDGIEVVELEATIEGTQ